MIRRFIVPLKKNQKIDTSEHSDRYPAVEILLALPETCNWRDGIRCKAILDTAAEPPLTLSRDVADAIGLVPHGKQDIDGSAGRCSTDVAYADFRFTDQNEAFVRVPVTILDGYQNLAIIGLPIISLYKLTLIGKKPVLTPLEERISELPMFDE